MPVPPAEHGISLGIPHCDPVQEGIIPHQNLRVKGALRSACVIRGNLKKMHVREFVLLSISYLNLYHFSVVNGALEVGFGRLHFGSIWQTKQIHNF